MQPRSASWSAVAIACAVTSVAPPSHAANPLVTLPDDYGSTAAHRYAALDAQSCLAQLAERDLPFAPAPATAGVDAPVLLNGPLHGVTFNYTRTDVRPEGAVLDCRLLLALDDFSALLADHDVVQADFVAAYRPDRSGRAKSGQRHSSALAIDIRRFHARDGSTWVVAHDFTADIGAATCGRHVRVPSPVTAASSALRAMLCDAGHARIFNLLLTPNYDKDHHDHVHLEVRRNIRWFLVQ